MRFILKNKDLQALFTQKPQLNASNIDMGKWPACPGPDLDDWEEWHEAIGPDQHCDIMNAFQKFETAKVDENGAISSGSYQYQVEIKPFTAIFSCTVPSGKIYNFIINREDFPADLFGKSAFEIARSIASRLSLDISKPNKPTAVDSPLIAALAWREAFIAGRYNDPSEIYVQSNLLGGKIELSGVFTGYEPYFTNIDAPQVYNLSFYSSMDDETLDTNVGIFSYEAIFQSDIWDYLTSEMIESLANDCNAILLANELPVIPDFAISDLMNGPNNQFAISRIEGAGQHYDLSNLGELNVQNLEPTPLVTRAYPVIQSLKEILTVRDGLVETSTSTYQIHPVSHREDGWSLWLQASDSNSKISAYDEKISHLPIFTFDLEVDSDSSESDETFSKFLRSIPDLYPDASDEIKLSKNRDTLTLLFHAFLELLLSRHAHNPLDDDALSDISIDANPNGTLEICLADEGYEDSKFCIPSQEIYSIKGNHLVGISAYFQGYIPPRPSLYMANELEASAKAVFARLGVTDLDPVIKFIDEHCLAEDSQ